MKAISRTAMVVALMAGLSACGQSASDNQSAGNGEVTAGNAMENSMMADPSNPYGEAEMRMHDAMTAAVGADVSDTWVRKMIEHHKGAIEMTNVLASQGGDPRVLEMARASSAKQQTGVEELQPLIRQSGSPDPASAQAYQAAETQMHDKMMAAKGADASETWMRKMIEHHRGAIAMSEIVVARGQDARVKAAARKAMAEQRKEIAELEAMLSGAAAPATAAPAAVPEPAASLPAAVKIAPVPPAKPAPKPKAAPKPAANPPASHDMGNMSGHDMGNMQH